MQPVSSYKPVIVVNNLDPREIELAQQKVQIELEHLNDIIGTLQSPVADSGDSPLSIYGLELLQKKCLAGLRKVPELLEIESQIWQKGISSSERQELFKRRDAYVDYFLSIGIDPQQTSQALFETASENLRYSYRDPERSGVNSISHHYRSEMHNMRNLKEGVEQRNYALLLLVKQKLEESKLLQQQREKQLEQCVAIVQQDIRLLNMLEISGGVVNLDLAFIETSRLKSYLKQVLAIELTTIESNPSVMQAIERQFGAEFDWHGAVYSFRQRLQRAIDTELENRNAGPAQPRPVSILATSKQIQTFAIITYFMAPDIPKIDFGKSVGKDGKSLKLNYDNLAKPAAKKSTMQVIKSILPGFHKRAKTVQAEPNMQPDF